MNTVKQHHSEFTHSELIFSIFLHQNPDATVPSSSFLHPTAGQLLFHAAAAL
jgi:hypothetical protein